MGSMTKSSNGWKGELDDSDDDEEDDDSDLVVVDSNPSEVSKEEAEGEGKGKGKEIVDTDVSAETQGSSLSSPQEHPPIPSSSKQGSPPEFGPTTSQKGTTHLRSPSAASDDMHIPGSFRSMPHDTGDAGAAGGHSLHTWFTVLRNFTLRAT